MQLTCPSFWELFCKEPKAHIGFLLGLPDVLGGKRQERSTGGNLNCEPNRSRNVLLVFEFSTHFRSQEARCWLRSYLLCSLCWLRLVWKTQHSLTCMSSNDKQIFSFTLICSIFWIWFRAMNSDKDWFERLLHFFHGFAVVQLQLDATKNSKYISTRGASVLSVSCFRFWHDM